METPELKWNLKIPEPKDLKNGDAWFLLSSSWVKKFLSNPSDPGPIDNSDLLDEKGELKAGLEMSKDFHPVIRDIWNELALTFPSRYTKDPIARFVRGGQLSIYPPDLLRLRDKILMLSYKSRAVGESWYLVSLIWYQKLMNYLDEDIEGKNPGPIDNSSLLMPSGELMNNLEENVNFIYLNKPIWDEIVERFSIVPDQEPIERKVVMDRKQVPSPVIDLYPLELFLLDSKKEKIKFKCSKYDTRESLIEKVRKALKMDPGAEIKVKIEEEGKVLKNFEFQRLSKGSQTLESVGLQNGAVLIVEEKDDNGEWIRNSSAKPLKIRNKNTSMGILSINSEDKKESTESSYSSFPTRYNMVPYSEGCEEENSRPGICGLSNLGNTCFMNSIIQGLSNTPPITEYFANDNYIEDINKTNPLGMKGEIAMTFGEMIKQMWSGRYKYINPRAFKSAVGRFAPQFSGYQQQDSQELLTFLLDGLHEDLNRVKNKPYIEIKDSGDRADEEVALEAWEVYKKRNDSVILDVFHGLLKSTLICPVCSKVSVTFDPFCYLSLPLPDYRERQLKVRVVWYDKSKLSTLFKLTVPKAGTISDLLVALSKETKISEDHFEVVEILSNKIHKEFKLDNYLSTIIDRDEIFIYELPSISESDIYTTIYFKEGGVRGANKFFYPPIMMKVKKGISGDDLYKEIISHIDPLVKKPDPEDLPLKINDCRNNNNDEEEEEDDDDKDTSLASEGMKMNLGEDDESSSNERSTIFRLCIVSLIGTIVERYIELSEENIFSEKKHFLAIEWTNENIKLYFNDKFASKLEYDDSFDRTHQKAPIKLSDCLELYTTTEKLGEDDAWYCPRCSEHQRATKKFDLWSLPSILVISLKRFSYTRNWRDKLDTMVDFPIKGLDMSPYIINPNHDPAIYDLIAVSNHYGGMGGGHYTAMAKNNNDGEWYNFDDAGVFPRKEKEVVTSAAYVLFYQRRETRSKAPSSTVTTPNNPHLTNGLNGRITGKNGNLSASSGEEEEKMDVN